VSDRFEDHRGVIQDVFGKIDAVTRITTVAGPSAATTSTTKTTQWTLVLSGACSWRAATAEPLMGRARSSSTSRASRTRGRRSRTASASCSRRGPRSGEDYESDTHPARGAAAMRVAIIGLGVIGSAQAEMFAGHDLVTYDPASRRPTRPGDRGVRLRDRLRRHPGRPGRPRGPHVRRAAASDLPPGVPAVLRSTVPPGTTDRLFGGSGRLYAHAPSSWARTSCIPGSAPRTCRT
jgi:hypothetical protein